MSSGAQIALVAVAAGLACSLAGVFLVLRRLAMIADAISHAVLPGLVAGYVLANGPNLLFGFLGAVVSGLLTVYLVETLNKTRRVTSDTAIGLVFPAMFALGVYVISRYFPNLHIDTDAVLYGEIAFAPFDTLALGGREYGPVSFWVLGGLGLFNALVLTALYKELKLATFDAALSATLGFAPVVLHYVLMTVVAVTTVGAFSAVGAILAVALIVVPAVTASLLTTRLNHLIALAIAVGVGSALAGYGLATLWNVSISGMMASTLGAVFFLALLFAPARGIISQWSRRRRQREEFATDVLLIHLATHLSTPEEAVESTLLHIERELGWSPDRASQIAVRAERAGLLQARSGSLQLTQEGQVRATQVAAR